MAHGTKAAHQDTRGFDRNVPSYHLPTGPSSTPARALESRHSHLTSNSYPSQKLNRTVFRPQDKHFLSSSSYATEHSCKCNETLLVVFFLGPWRRGQAFRLLLITCQKQRKVSRMLSSNEEMPETQWSANTVRLAQFK